jgi:hypothetical protein
MWKYIIALIVFLMLSMLSTRNFAQGYLLKSIGKLVSISESKVVLHYQNSDHVFMIQSETKLLVERFVNSLQVISASAPLRWVQ